MNKFTKYPIYSFSIALLLILSGCGITNSDSDGNRKVDVKMRVITPSAPKMISAGPAIQAIDSLTEIKLLVEELELESTADNDSLDFEVDDLVVNLPLDGSELVLSSANVPAGTYDEFELEIEHDDDSNVSDPDFINDSGDDDDGYTVVVKGFYNGEEFTYRSMEDFEIEMEFNPPLEITNDSSPSVAINVDPYLWFKDSSGNDLDPSDPANRETIDENIENSFEVEQEEEDDDDDDDDDDGDDD